MFFFLCGCAYLSFSDLLAYGYGVMMLNVLRSDITIKIQHHFPSDLGKCHLGEQLQGIKFNIDLNS